MYYISFSDNFKTAKVFELEIACLHEYVSAVISRTYSRAHSLTEFLAS
jgi:hypothetical protein